MTSENATVRKNQPELVTLVLITVYVILNVVFLQSESELRRKSLDDLKFLSLSVASVGSHEMKPCQQPSSEERQSDHAATDSSTANDDMAMEITASHKQSSENSTSKATECKHKDIDGVFLISCLSNKQITKCLFVALDDPLYSPEYAQDVYSHMRQKEVFLSISLYSCV